MRNFLLISSIFWSFTVYGQSPSPLLIGKKDSLSSKILEEQRYLWVYLPNEYDKEKQYPVIYLLDAEINYHATVGILKNLENIEVPEMIVVGVHNAKNRFRDLTPHKGDLDHPLVSDHIHKVSGGVGNFVAFLDQELVPFIESKYSTAPYRIFIGHPLGGLFGLYAMAKNDKLFNSYIIIDPTVWWGKAQLLNELPTKVDLLNAKLYLAIANTIAPGSSFETVRKDTSIFGNNHIRYILDLDEKIKKAKGGNLIYRSKYYPNEGHQVLSILGIYDGLRFIFSSYPSGIFDDVEGFAKDPNSVYNKIKSHYLALSEEYGYEVLPDQYLINFLGYQCMEIKKFEEAEKYFTLNISYYPRSANVYDSLGDLYVAMGRKDHAVLNYKKALSIQENEATRNKLESITK